MVSKKDLEDLFYRGEMTASEIQERIEMENAKQKILHLQQRAEAYASSLYPRLDNFGQASVEWKEAYHKYLKNPSTLTNRTISTKPGSLNSIDTTISNSIPVVIASEQRPGQLPQADYLKKSKVVPAEIFAVYVDDLGSPALKQLFVKEADATAYTKGLSGSMVKKVSVLDSLDSLSEIEKIEMKDRNK